MERNAFFNGARRHAECPPDWLTPLGPIPGAPALDVCRCCFVLVPRSRSIEEDVDPPACVGCGMVGAYGLIDQADQRWWAICPMCGARNPGCAQRGPYVGSWVPDEPPMDQPIAFRTAPDWVVDDLDAADPCAWLDDPAMKWIGYTWALDGTEVLFEGAGPGQLAILYPARGWAAAARLVHSAVKRVQRVNLTGDRRARLTALVERELARAHDRLSPHDTDQAGNLRRLAQAWVRLAGRGVIGR